jgi:hypothetical protein
MRELRDGPLDGVSDVDASAALARLLHDELEIFGTHGNGAHLDDADMKGAIQALKAATGRLGIECALPFRDFSGFYKHWRSCGAVGNGGWQARRDILDALFDPLHDQLAELEEMAVGSSLASPATTHHRTGWPKVDTEISELRRHFASAHTPQDYRAVGLDCVAVTEALSETVYNPKKHLRDGEDEPPVAKTKMRLDRFVDDASSGPSNAAVRKLVKATVELAQEVKHSGGPTRRDAGIAADTVILLANMLRRLDEPE